MIDRLSSADGNVVGGIDMLDSSDDMDGCAAKTPSTDEFQLILIVSTNIYFVAYPIEFSATFDTPIFFSTHSLAR